MKRRKTSLNVNELFQIPGRRPKKEWEKAKDEKGEPVRGLWQRKGVFYAQLCPSGKTQQYKYRLEHAQTVPQAITAMQVLKDSQQKGALLPPNFQKKQTTEELTEKDGHTIGEAIANYREQRDLLELFDPLTCSRQNNSLNKWDEKFGKLPLSSLKKVMRSDFAKWRKSKDGGKVSGRTIDIDMGAFNHVVERAVELNWLEESPFGKWKKLDKGPIKKARLLSLDELDTFCAAAFVPKKEMDEQHWPPEYQAEIRKCNQAFSDFFYLLSYSGGREKETRRQRWSQVRWSKRTLFFPGKEAKKGAGKPASDREVEFNSALEAHLRAMYTRRNPKCDWMFPNADGTGPVKSFRKQLDRVRVVTGMDDVGFHHGRHYFISSAMMSQPYIDVKTIATWVGHRDGGALILRVYGHLRPGHAAKMAAHVDLRPAPMPEAPPSEGPA